MTVLPFFHVFTGCLIFYWIFKNDINHIFDPEEWLGFLNDEGKLIFTIVCYLVPQEVFNPLQRKYVIMIDKSDEREEVSTLDLYKLTKVNSVYSLENGGKIK